MTGDCHVRFCERFRGEIPLYLLDLFLSAYQSVRWQDILFDKFWLVLLAFRATWQCVWLLALGL